SRARGERSTGAPRPDRATDELSAAEASPGTAPAPAAPPPADSIAPARIAVVAVRVSHVARGALRPQVDRVGAHLRERVVEVAHLRGGRAVERSDHGHLAAGRVDRGILEARLAADEPSGALVR